MKIQLNCVASGLECFLQNILNWWDTSKYSPYEELLYFDLNNSKVSVTLYSKKQAFTLKKQARTAQLMAHQLAIPEIRVQTLPRTN